MPFPKPRGAHLRLGEGGLTLSEIMSPKMLTFVA